MWALHGGYWKHMDGGDGGYFTFIRSGHALRRNLGGPYALTEWDGGSLTDRGAITVYRTRPGDPNPTRTINGGFAIVNAPVAWDVFGAKIFGYGWTGVDIYSFWNPSGFLGWRWEYESSIPITGDEILSAGGSANGQVSFFGTSRGRIFSYDRRVNRLSQNEVDLSGIANSSEYGINRMLILSDTLGFALLNRWNPGASNFGYVLKFDGTRWAPLRGATLDDGTGRVAALPVERHWSIEADWTVQPNRLVMSTDDQVYVSADSGATWQKQSVGLPKRAHLADLRFVVFPDGTKRFYLSTYGRSVWYADVR